MPDYLHNALRGDQIHEAKIKILAEDSPMPVPEWEGQLVALGRKLYYSAIQDGTLTWIQPISYNTPQLPINVITFESGFENPPQSRNKAGIIYQNTDTKDIWYSEGDNWIKLGKNDGNSTLNLISGRATYNWESNRLGLLNPVESSEENCLLIAKMIPQKYYFAISTPPMLAIGGSDDNLFYVLVRDDFYTFKEISVHPDNSKSLLELNLEGVSNQYSIPELALALKRNGTTLFLNFEFDLDKRYFKVKGLATIYFGY